MSNSTFGGFPKQTLTFLRGLGKNNSKAWFDDHRDAYEEHYLEPAKAFVSAIGPRLQKFADVNAEPRVNGSIFRINRDVRFSKDKTPYKDHLDMWFWAGDRKGWGPGFFFRLRAKELILGAGTHKFDKPVMAAYRDAVADDGSGKVLARLLAKLEKAGYAVEGEHYKKVPKGFDPEHPRADLLRHAGLAVSITMKLPPEVHTAAFPAFCAKHFKNMTPVHNWLSELD